MKFWERVTKWIDEAKWAQVLVFCLLAAIFFVWLDRKAFRDRGWEDQEKCDQKIEELNKIMRGREDSLRKDFDSRLLAMQRQQLEDKNEMINFLRGKVENLDTKIETQVTASSRVNNKIIRNSKIVKQIDSIATKIQ